MNASLFRASGIAIVLGAALEELALVLSPGRGSGLERFANPVFTPQWELRFAGALLLIAGLPAIYSILSKRARRLGLFAVISTFLGIALVDVARFPLNGLAFPVLAARPESAVAIEAINRAVAPFIWTGLVMNLLGIVALGVSVLRTGVLPRLAGAFLIVGIVVDFFDSELSVLLPADLARIGGASLAYVAAAWLGFAMIRTTWAPADTQVSAQPAPVAKGA